MTAALKELGAYIELKRPDCVRAWDVTHDELNIDVTPSNIVGFTEFLKSDQTCRFSTLVDMTAVDYPDRPKRFDVVYHFLSMYQNQRIRLRLSIREEDMVPSIVEVHPSANWFEREVFDMFGILFSGHPDLRRILTDFGAEVRQQLAAAPEGQRAAAIIRASFAPSCFTPDVISAWMTFYVLAQTNPQELRLWRI